MDMQMSVRLFPIPIEIVLVLAVLVVAMPVRVRQLLVLMPVFTALTQMQPHANTHQRCGTPEQDGRHLGPQRQ